MDHLTYPPKSAPRWTAAHHPQIARTGAWLPDAHSPSVHNAARSKYDNQPLVDYSPPPFSFSPFTLKRYLSRHWSSLNPFPIFPQRLPRSPASTQFVPTIFPTSSTVRFIFLCGLWYTTSALSSNTGKIIMTQFRYPVTLTFVQFGFVAIFCLLFMSPVIRFTRLRSPTVAIVRTTLPMGMFQVGGHMCSSMAISRIPVSTLHTIKALSPLFTVAAYAVLFGVDYSPNTYVSLFPLTIGVMLACSFDISASNAVGLLCALGSALVFVSSNIFFKRIMPSNTGAITQSNSHKLDKLNLLFYSSSMAFLLMTPVWVLSDLQVLLKTRLNPGHIAHPNQGHSMPHSITYYFVMNGTVHFAQNIIAFIILSSTSPVTYSIASLIKRVAVICASIVWFNQNVHPLQGFGISMTFLGLYMYNNAKSDVENGEKKMRRVEAARAMVLPTTEADIRMMTGLDSLPLDKADQPVAETSGIVSVAAYGRPRGALSTMHPPQSPNHEPRSHPRTHSRLHPHPRPPPNLTIKITLPTNILVSTPKDDSLGASPIESYPSPPPSVDSPRSSTTSLPLPNLRIDARQTLVGI